MIDFRRVLIHESQPDIFSICFLIYKEIWHQIMTAKPAVGYFADARLQTFCVSAFSVSPCEYFMQLKHSHLVEITIK